MKKKPKIKLTWADRIFGVPDKDGKRKAFTARATGTSGKNKW